VVTICFFKLKINGQDDEKNGFDALALQAGSIL